MPSADSRPSRLRLPDLAARLLIPLFLAEACATKREGGPSGPAAPGGMGGALVGRGGSGGLPAGGGTAGSRAGGSGGATAGSAGTVAGGAPGVGDASAGAPGSGGGGGAVAPTPDAPSAEGKPLRIYWIDVEGGGATLLIAPTGESLLFDAGWNQARDIDRIVAVLDAELPGKRLDYFLASHFHVDHVGGVGRLAQAVTIGNFLDKGASVEGGSDNGYRAAVGASRRTTVQPGQKIALGPVELTIAAASGRVTEPLPGAGANPLCAGAQQKNDSADEDPQSVGFVARYGKFDFVALGDLTWGVEHRLACPTNRLGQVELFQASQHGSIESNPPQLVHALAPLAIVLNNGAAKGGAAMALELFKASPGMKDVWQVHRSNAAGGSNAAEEFIANPGPGDDGHWIRASVRADGQFSITNGRTMMSRSYQSR